jgi:hypothetical protein
MLWLQTLTVARNRVLERLSDPSKEGIRDLGEEQIGLLISILDGDFVVQLANELAAQGRCANCRCGVDLGEGRHLPTTDASSLVHQEDDDETTLPHEVHGSDDDEDEAGGFDRRQRASSRSNRDRVRLRLPLSLFCSEDCCVATRDDALRGYALAPNDPFVVDRVQEIFPTLRRLADASVAASTTAAVQLKENAPKKKPVSFADEVQAATPVPSNTDVSMGVSSPPVTTVVRSMPRVGVPTRRVPAGREALEILVVTVTPFTGWVFRHNARRLLAETTSSTVSRLPWIPLLNLTDENEVKAPQRPPPRQRSTAEDMRYTRLMDALTQELPRVSLLLRIPFHDDPVAMATLTKVVSLSLSFDTEFDATPEGFLMVALALVVALTGTEEHIRRLFDEETENALRETLAAMHTSEVVFTQLVHALYGV